jgi:hypothetical protein
MEKAIDLISSRLETMVAEGLWIVPPGVQIGV